jgi:diacylglycerol kinase (ATP)
MKRILKAFKYSYEGLVSCYKYEAAFRQETFVLLISIPLALWLGDNKIEMLLMIGSIVFVMIIELLNSAIENVNDRISPEYHDLCKRAKDQSSGAVMLSILLAVAVWVVVLAS